MPTWGEPARRFAAWLGAALLLGAMAVPMVRGQIYLGDDLGCFHAPMRWFYSRSLAAGLSPAWCPDFFCGYDLQGEGQAGMSHPLHRLLYGALPLYAAFNLEILSSYVFAFAGMMLLLLRRGLPSDASAFGATLFTFAGYNLFHFHHVNAVASAAHMPWLLLGIDGSLRAVSARARAWARLLLAAATASLLLVGYPQNVAYALLLECLFAIYLVVDSQPGTRRLAALAGALLVGVLGGGAQLLPTWDTLRYSERQTPTYEFLALGSLHPLNLVQTIAPYLYRARVYAPTNVQSPLPAMELEWRTGEFGLYNGAVIPVLLLYAVLRRRGLGRDRKFAAAAMGLATVGLLLAFGRYTPLYALYVKVPVLNLFRVNARYVLFYHLATAAVAAIALADLARQAARGERMSWWQAPLLAAPAAVALLIALGARSFGAVWPQTLLRHCQGSNGAIAVGAGLIVVTAFLVIAAARGHRVALVGMILFAAADVGAYSRPYLTHLKPGHLEDLVAATGVPPGPPPGSRVKQLRGFPDNTLVFRGLHIVDGYVGLTPRRVLDPNSPTTWRLAAVEWLLDQPWGGKWSRLTGSFPHVRLVPRAFMSNRPKSDLDTIDHQTAALVEADIGLSGNRPAGNARLLAEQPGHLVIQTDAPARQLLVIADRYHPGWRADVDGQDQPVVRVNGDFLGCVVAPGQHRVVLRFDPWSHRAGRALSLLGLVLMLAMSVPSLRPRTRAAGREAIPAHHLTSLGLSQALPRDERSE
jgi:hypothetical protein